MTLPEQSKTPNPQQTYGAFSRDLFTYKPNRPPTIVKGDFGEPIRASFTQMSISLSEGEQGLGPWQFLATYQQMLRAFMITATLRTPGRPIIPERTSLSDLMSGMLSYFRSVELDVDKIGICGNWSTTVFNLENANLRIFTETLLTQLNVPFASHLDLNLLYADTLFPLIEDKQVPDNLITHSLLSTPTGKVCSRLGYGNIRPHATVINKAGVYTFFDQPSKKFFVNAAAIRE